jgi:DNA primase
MNKFELLIKNQPRVQKGSGNEYLIRCPFHTDSKPSLGVNVAKGLFICYACGEKGNAVKLTKALKKDISWEEAVSYFEPNSAADVRGEITLPDEYHPIPIFGNAGVGGQGVVAREYLVERGITSQLIREFKLGYCVTGRYVQRIIIPVYMQGRLQTFIARDYTGKAATKVKYPVGSNASKALFGYDRAVALNAETVVVTEGWADVLAVLKALKTNVLFDNGKYGAVALGTNMISPEQINLLSKFKDFIVLLDNDKEGRRAISQVQSSLSLCGIVYIASLESSKDPGVARSEEICKALWEARK